MLSVKNNGGGFFSYLQSPPLQSGDGAKGCGGLTSSSLAKRVEMKYFFWKGWGWTKGGRLFRKGGILCFDMKFLY